MSDSLLVIVFGSLTVLSLGLGVVGVYLAYKNSVKFENEVKMVLWGIIGVGGFVFGGMCVAYFLLPILFQHLKN